MTVDPTTRPARTSAGLPRALQVGALLVVTAVLLLVVPAALGGYWTRIATLSAVYAVAAAGAGLLYGRLGFVSLNQVALVGVGGWFFLRLAHLDLGVPSPVLLLVAGLATCLVGTVIGLPSLRLSGLALALVTLMAAGAFAVVFYGLGFPNGGSGFSGRVTGAEAASDVPRPSFAASDEAMYRYTVVVAGLLFVALWLVLRGRAGRAWAAIRQSEAGAYAAGVAVTRYRLLALALTSSTSGVAGALLASGTGRLDPVSFPAQQSIVLFAVVLIGGAFSLLGGVLAGLLYAALPAVLTDVGVDSNLVLVVFGLGLVQALVTAPEGMAGQVLGAARRLTGRSRPPAPAVPEPAVPTTPAEEATPRA